MGMMLLMQSPRARARLLAFGTQPPIALLGASVPTFTVEARKVSGEVDTGYTGTVTVAPSSGSWGGTLARACVAGVATFNDLTLPSAFVGDVTFAAAAAGYGSASVTVLVPTKVYRSSVSAFTVVAGVGQWTVQSGGLSAGETVTVAGTTLTCVASGAGADQFDASSNTTTAATNLKNCINASAGLSGVVTASSSGATVTITRAVSTDDSGIAVSHAANLAVATPSSSLGGQFDGTNIKQAISQVDDARGSAWGSATKATAALRPASVPSALNSLRGIGLLRRSLQLIDSASIPTQPPFTEIARIKTTQSGVRTSYLMTTISGTGTNGDHWSLGIDTTGHAIAQMAVSGGTGSGSGGASATTAATVNDGAWHVVCAEHIAAASRKVSTDDGTVATDTTSRSASDATQFVLGGSAAKGANVSGPTLGYMLDAILVGRDVTAAEITYLVAALAADV